MHRTRRTIVIALATLALVATACGDDGGAATPRRVAAAASTRPSTCPTTTTRSRPPSAAAPGDLVLIAPGTYEEAVDVETEDLTIRGLDRNEVVLDGGFELENGIRVLADGVAVENMTARNYTTNGFFWTGVTGYRGSYLTAFRNGDYGVYAFDATQGPVRAHLRVRQPRRRRVHRPVLSRATPCIDDVISEYNGLGYSGTNSGGNLSSSTRPSATTGPGSCPTAARYELCYPERDNTIVGNIVHDNMQPDTPGHRRRPPRHGQRHPRRRRQPRT